jgi:hypothetical protein
MKSFALAGLALLLLPLCAQAHVGSPNVFFEGHAGAHALSVVIRPPLTLPGVAQIDIRVGDEDVTSVTVRPEFVEAGDVAAPEATRATAVAGDTRLFNAAVWLLRRGSYGVQISVESPRGGGTVAVPLQASALERPVMPPALGALLVACGAILVGWAVWLIGATAGTAAAGVGALVLGGAVYAGNLRWQQMDRNFNNALYKPLPVRAEIRSDGAQALLQLAPDSGAAPESAWDTLVTDHGKLMHLFLIRENTLDAFAHLHPVRRDARAFEGVLPPLPAGSYELYAELTHESGASETLVGKVDVPAPAGLALPSGEVPDSGVWCLSPTAPVGNAARPSTLDFDDSWHASRMSPIESGRTRESALMGGGRMIFHSDGALVADRETSLRFTAFTAGGEAAALEPYMGMLGHAVVRRSDGGVFTHLHPVGTISMAAAELLAKRDGSTEPMPPPSLSEAREVVFPYAFPRAGRYRMWVQVRTKRAPGVLTGVFDVDVSDG